MRNYILNIAGYNIGFEASAKGPELVPSVRFLRNISHITRPEILIRIHSGSMILPADAQRVFHAPYVEEINGIMEEKLPNFWSIWKSDSWLYIKTIFPQSAPGKNGILKFSLTAREWDLWIEGTEKETDPFEYPLDGLILYYLTVINGDIMIHASGVNHSGNGYLFSGVSGKGKTTLAKLWDNAGASVIHDDRLIIRKIGMEYRMFNTPVYNNDIPHESLLNKIFIIEHGTENKIIPVSGAAAVSLVMTNCIQHNWDSNNIECLLDSVSKLCGTIPTFKLSFCPDKRVIYQILENEQGK